MTWAAAKCEPWLLWSFLRFCCRFPLGNSGNSKSFWYNCCSKPFRGLAQLASARGLGPRGRRFESFIPDHIKKISICWSFLYLLGQGRERISEICWEHISSNRIESFIYQPYCDVGRWRAAYGNDVAARRASWVVMLVQRRGLRMTRPVAALLSV